MRIQKERDPVKFKKQREEVLKEFNTKHEESGCYDMYCSYCESYREGSEFVGKGNSERYCKSCLFIMSHKVKIGLSFDEIIETWDSSSHKLSVKRLPYLKGNNNKGFKVRGFTYIDSDKYDELVKVMWTKSKGYLNSSNSKDNLARLGRLKDYPKLTGTPVNRLHRVVLGLENYDRNVSDHINGYTLDNRGCNLRVASNTLNSRNTRKTKSITSSKYKGVSLKATKSRTKPYQAQYSHKGVYKSLKYHFTEEEAALSYDKHLRSLNLDGSLFNFPEEGEASVFR